MERDLHILRETYEYEKRPVYMRYQCKKYLSPIEYINIYTYGKRPMCIERDLCIWKETCVYEVPVQEVPVPIRI